MKSYTFTEEELRKRCQTALAMSVILILVHGMGEEPDSKDVIMRETIDLIVSIFTQD